MITYVSSVVIECRNQGCSLGWGSKKWKFKIAFAMKEGGLVCH